MRTLLRDGETGRFYRLPGEWVGSELEATDFETRERIMDIARKLGKGQLELFVIADDGRPILGERLEL